MPILRMMPLPIYFLILNTHYEGFQMSYHLFQKFFGKEVKIKQMSFLFSKFLDWIAHHRTNIFCLFYKIYPISKGVSTNIIEYLFAVQFSTIPTNIFCLSYKIYPISKGVNTEIIEYLFAVQLSTILTNILACFTRYTVCAPA